MRIPVFYVCKQQRNRPAYASAQSRDHFILNLLNSKKAHVINFMCKILFFI